MVAADAPEGLHVDLLPKARVVDAAQLARVLELAERAHDDFDLAQALLVFERVALAPHGAPEEGAADVVHHDELWVASGEQMGMWARGAKRARTVNPGCAHATLSSTGGSNVPKLLGPGWASMLDQRTVAR